MRRALPALVAYAALVAGCASPASTSSGPPTASGAAHALTFTNALLSPDVVHAGPICGCGSRRSVDPTNPDPQRVGDRGFLAFFGSALTPDGRLVASFARDSDAAGQDRSNEIVAVIQG
ncbi:MAG: hypothetical protein ACYDCK_01150 [Thermoplasmatota archaeon]